MGSTVSTRVRDADALLAGRAGQVLNLKKELALAAPQSEDAEKLLARASDLLATLAKDIKNIGDDLGENYDLRRFQALHDLIDQVRQNVNSVPLVCLHQAVLGYLRPGWQAVAGGGRFAWYRGTNMDNALEVFLAGHFNPSYQGSGGNSLGVGTYFIDTYAEAVKYVDNRYGGKGCVFGMNVSGLRVLKARHLGQPLPAAPPAHGWQRMSNVEFDGDLGYDAERRIRDSVNTAKTLVQLAKENEYHAVEWVRTDRGPPPRRGDRTSAHHSRCGAHRVLASILRP